MSVSVIIPCYKDAATLSRALDSVYAQTQSADEVIVVNDDSPETSAIETVLLTYPGVKYIVNQKNLGLAATRNVGVHAASGDIVCFLDADDELHPQKIELQRSLYHPQLAISCNVMRISNERGIDRVVLHTGEVKYSEFRDSSNLVRRNTLTGASLFMSRALFLAHGGYDETLRSCEDFDLWLRLLDAGITVLNIEWPLYLYRLNEQGLSRNLPDISYWELEVVKKYHARRCNHGQPPFDEGRTLALWLFRHFVRYEQCRDPKLLHNTRDNLKLLEAWPSTRMALLLSQRIGLPWLFHCISSNRNIH
jgi:glycosyltransferase involved in cell wall biosynthesis